MDVKNVLESLNQMDSTMRMLALERIGQEIESLRDELVAKDREVEGFKTELYYRALALDNTVIGMRKKRLIVGGLKERIHELEEQIHRLIHFCESENRDPDDIELLHELIGQSRKRLQDRIESLQGERDYWFAHQCNFDVTSPVRVVRMAEFVGLERDRLRVDWLSSKRAVSAGSVDRRECLRWDDLEGPSLRAAIDAARGKKV